MTQLQMSKDPQCDAAIAELVRRMLGDDVVEVRPFAVWRMEVTVKEATVLPKWTSVEPDEAAAVAAEHGVTLDDLCYRADELRHHLDQGLIPLREAADRGERGLRLKLHDEGPLDVGLTGLPDDDLLLKRVVAVLSALSDALFFCLSVSLVLEATEESPAG